MTAAREAFDAALSLWLVRQAVAEERLTSFAFRESQPHVVIGDATSHDELRHWILGIVGGPGVANVLRSLGASGREIGELVADGTLGLRPGDRVALATRIGVLAAAGLVVRELETDRVNLTELGRSALALADETEPVGTVEAEPVATVGTRA